MSFHDEASAEIGESQFVNTYEMPRSPGMIKSWHDINKKTEIARLRRRYSSSLFFFAKASKKPAMAHRQAGQRHYWYSGNESIRGFEVIPLDS
jgi:hypothetical protein